MPHAVQLKRYVWRSVTLACALFNMQSSFLHGNEPINRRLIRETLQANIRKFPEARVNTDIGKVFYRSLDLSPSQITIENRNFFAFRFRTPDQAEQMVWSFRALPGHFEWGILAAEGTLTGFRFFEQVFLQRNIPDLGPLGSHFIVQRYFGPDFKPNTEYILFFVVQSDAHNANILLSLNVFANKERLSFQEVFSALYAKPIPGNDERTTQNLLKFDETRRLMENIPGAWPMLRPPFY